MPITLLTVDEPLIANQTIYRGTDHVWGFRRVDHETGEPIVPTSAESQVREKPGGPIWATADVTIDPVEGWVFVSLPEAATAGADWDSHLLGRWDLEVVVNGQRYRWAQGNIRVSQDITR